MNDVRVFESPGAMRDQNRHVIRRNFAQGSENLLFGVGINSAGGFVQNPQVGIAQNQTCQREPLPLPTR